MTNRLANESSPYLLQHKNNPVNWYPWGEEALSRSKDGDLPIFLSVGYSACHWCHVMEHESFEDEGIAKILNDNFVCIKVDREERPDLDQIYMNAVMALRNGQGGWPLSAFLTPERDVFFGGTYWPPKSRMGMPGFNQVLLSVLDAFTNKRPAVTDQSKQISLWLNRSDAEIVTVEPAVVINAVRMLENQFDFQNGGFGTAPKFPHSMGLLLLNRVGQSWPEQGTPSVQTIDAMVDLNLSKIGLGGIYDHAGGGFARYSVDERWLVPHFEKMLYDNALLTFAYVERFQTTGNGYYKQVVEETFGYQLRDMTSQDGAFFSTEDADSEGEEGKFYVWSRQEFLEVTQGVDGVDGELGETLCEYFDISDQGNFEGHNILNVRVPMKEFVASKALELNSFVETVGLVKSALLESRSKRVRPGLDDKVLTSWNALMIRSMARAAVVFDDPTYLDAAIASANFLLNNLRLDNGRWLHTWRHGVASLDAYLDDYSYLLVAFVELYRSTFDEKWLVEAKSIADLMIEHFVDGESGGFYFTADDHEKLIARTKPFQDNSVPSGNSMAACGLLRLGRLLGDFQYVDLAEKTIEASGTLMTRAPMASGQMLVAATESLMPHRELVLFLPEDFEASLRLELQQAWLPNASVLCVVGSPDERSLLQAHLQGRSLQNKQPTLFVCERGSCQLPVIGASSVRATLKLLTLQNYVWEA